MNSTPKTQTFAAKTRTFHAGQWDLFAVIGLMACSAAYSIAVIAQAAGL